MSSNKYDILCEVPYIMLDIYEMNLYFWNILNSKLNYSI